MSLFTRSRMSNEEPHTDEVDGARGEVAAPRDDVERPVANGPATGMAAREPRAGRSRGSAAVGSVASGAITLSRLVMLVAVLIAVLIGLAIVLRDVSANTNNAIVSGIHDGANFFAGGFTGMVTFSGHPKRALSVDWGIALVAYLIAGAIIAGVISHFGRNGLAWEQRHRAGAVT